jgi:hypothetical protein
VQVGRNFLEGEVVVLVAVGATHLVKVLPCLLLRSKLGRGVTTSQNRSQAESKPKDSGPSPAPNVATSSVRASHSICLTLWRRIARSRSPS